MTNISPIGILVILAACGSSGGGVAPTTTYSPTSAVTGTPVTVLSADSSADSTTVRRDGSDYVLIGDTTFDIGTFDARQDGAGSGTFRSETDDSSVQLFIIDDGLGVSTRFTRNVESVVPTEGSATVNGDYVALLFELATDDVELIISGDASVTFDFEGGNASGLITNRTARNSMDNSVISTSGLADLTLEVSSTPTARGMYSGSVSGGELDLTATGGIVTNTGSGFYNVLIAGDVGDEGVGRVDISHSEVGGSGSFQESGALALGH